jgi:hypothetical protein
MPVSLAGSHFGIRFLLFLLWALVNAETEPKTSF